MLSIEIQMIERSPWYHLLNGPTQAGVGKTEGQGPADSVSKAKPRQLWGINWTYFRGAERRGGRAVPCKKKSHSNEV